MTTLNPTRPDSLAQPWYALYVASTAQVEAALRETGIGSRQYSLDLNGADTDSLIWTDSPERALAALREGGLQSLPDDQFLVLETTARRIYRAVTGLLKHNGVNNVVIESIASVLQEELIETELLDQHVMTEVARYTQNAAGQFVRLDGSPQWASVI